MNKISLLSQIFIAFVLAILLGSLFPEQISVVSPLGDLFLRLIQFIIAPLILATLITGVASLGDRKKLARLGSKTVVYFLATTFFAVTLGLLAAFIFSPGVGLNVPVPETGSVEVKETGGAIATLLNIIPTNPFAALAERNILQIIFFAIAIGIGITLVGEKAQPVNRFFDGFSEIMFTITFASGNRIANP